MKTENIKIIPKWNKSIEEVWNDKFANIEDKSRQKLKSRQLTIYYMAIAVIVILLIIPATAHFYTKEIIVPKGKHLVTELPDGSKVTLNAESSICYKPLWWSISKEIKLTGEAYFEVTKGKTFEVQSNAATVRVLGTSFNIYARSKKYNVTCLTGKVEVFDHKQSVILTPNMSTTLDNGNFTSYKIDNVKESIGWINDQFSFNSVPLIEVIKEIERQYNIKIVTPDNLDYFYTGKFSKTNKPDDILKIIEKPFGIKLKIE